MSVCRVSPCNSRTERPRKPKFGRMEAHHTGNPWTYLVVIRSKVKLIHAHTYSKCAISSEREVLQTSNSLHKRRTKTRINYMRRDLQGQRSSSQGHVTCLTPVRHKSRTKRPRNPEIVRKVVHHTGDNVLQGQRSKVEAGNSTWARLGRVSELMRPYLVGRGWLDYFMRSRRKHGRPGVLLV